MAEDSKELFRVAAVCHECGEEWTTNAKPSSKAPHECRKCGSTKTGKEDVFEVEL